MTSKDPWMPFYGTDFFEDPPVQAMTWEQRALYLRLLWVAWREGSIPADERGLAALVSMSPARFRKVWPAIAVKWRAESGRLVNDRLERVRGDRQERAERLAAISAKGVEARRLNRAGNRDGNQEPVTARSSSSGEQDGQPFRVRVRERVREASNLASSLSDAREENGSPGEVPDDPERARQAAAAVARIAAARTPGGSHGA